MTKIVGLRWLTFDINPCRPYWIKFANFSKIRVVLFCIYNTGNSLSDCSKKIKKIYRLENFARTSLSWRWGFMLNYFHLSVPSQSTCKNTKHCSPQNILIINCLLSLVPNEATVVNKERAAGYYRLSAYYLAKLCSELPLIICQPAMFFTIAYWMTGLNRSEAFLSQLLLLLLTAVAGQVACMNVYG